MADLRFYFDPVCPFAWTTSKWVRAVQEQRDCDVDWRFISLRMVNADLYDEKHFDEAHRARHANGLRLLRVAARVRGEHGADAVGRLYAGFGQELFETPGARSLDDDARTREVAGAALAAARLPRDLVDALDDEGLDLEIAQQTEEALAATGKDVGTPILHLAPPDGPAFFGPVISRQPEGEEVLRLWDLVSGLAAFPGFAELKRSLREPLQLPVYGNPPGG